MTPAAARSGPGAGTGGRSAPPPRVVHVTSRYPPDLGGMERAVEELSEALVAELHGPVEVVTGSRGPTGTRPEGPLLVHRLRAFDVGVTPIIPGLARALLRIRRPDLFHVHVAHAGVPEVVALVARLRRVPFVAHVHIDAGPTTWMGFLLDVYQRRVLARVLAGAGAVIVPTEGYRPVLVDKYGVDPSRIRVVPSGTLVEPRPTSVLSGIPRQGPLRMLTVGRIATEKNLPLLVDTVGVLRHEDRLDVRLDVVGDGPARDELVRYIAEHHLESSVRLVGRRGGDDLVEAYDAADLFVMTSWAESFGVVLIEAMARGLPIVAPDIVGVRDVVIDGENGLLVGHSVDSVRNAVLRILEEPGLREDLIAGARAHAEHYRWPELAHRCVDIYRDVLRTRSEVPPS